MWLAVCDSDWTTADAIVVCRQLNLPYGAVEALSGTQQFGLASGPVWLQQIRCTGSEASFIDCTIHALESILSHCDDHNRNVGVICKDGMYVFLVCFDIKISSVPPLL